MPLDKPAQGSNTINGVAEFKDANGNPVICPISLDTSYSPARILMELPDRALRDLGGVDVLDIRTATGTTVIDDVNDALRVNLVAGSVSISGADGAVLDGVDPLIKATVKDFANSNPLTVHSVDTNGDYSPPGAGTQYTEDAVAAANPVGNAIIVVRDDARVGSLTNTDGDNVALRGTNAGEVYVKHVDAIPVTDNGGALTVDGTVAASNLPATVDTNSGVKSASTLRVILATDQPALTNKLLVTPDSVALPANQSCNTAQINGVTPLMGAGNTGTGSLRVTIATDQTQLTNSLKVIDDSVLVDDAAFTPATSKVSMAGFEAD